MLRKSAFAIGTLCLALAMSVPAFAAGGGNTKGSSATAHTTAPGQVNGTGTATSPTGRNGACNVNKPCGGSTTGSSTTTHKGAAANGSNNLAANPASGAGVCNHGMVVSGGKRQGSMPPANGKTNSSCGASTTTTSQKPPITSQKPPTTSQRPPTTTQKPPTTSQRPVTSGQVTTGTTTRTSTGTTTGTTRTTTGTTAGTTAGTTTGTTVGTTAGTTTGTGPVVQGVSRSSSAPGRTTKVAGSAIRSNGPQVKGAFSSHGPTARAGGAPVSLPRTGGADPAPSSPGLPFALIGTALLALGALARRIIA